VFVAIAVAGLSAAACDVHGISEPGSLSAIVVSPNPATIAANGTQQFSAVGKDFSGTNVTISPSWSVVAGGGTISASGLFTAGPTPGTFASTVKATSGSISGTATVIVTTGPLASITVTPNPDTLAINGTQLFTAVGRDVAGNVVVITPTWSVVASGGTITTAGSFTAGTVPGTFLNTVKATSGTLSGTADVVVTPGPLATITVTPTPVTLAINGTQQFTAVGKDASGNVVAITPVWSAVSGGTIDATTGLFTAGTVPATFTNTVQATSGSISGTATVVVTAGQLDRIIVTPNPDTLAINGIQQFIATGLDIAGNPVAITPTWAVVASGGTIDTTTGLFTAGTVLGTFIKTVTATSGGHTGTATVVVTTGPLASITVTPNPDTVSINGQTQFIATGRDASGNLVALTIAPTWSVDSGGGTIISTTGLFTAGLTTGTFPNTVKATVGTVNGTATVVVIVAQPFLDLGTAAPNGIMAGTAVTCTTSGLINADVSISPGITITGPCTISGTTHLNDATAIQNQIDLTAAFDKLAALPCPAANVIGAADIGGTTKTAGVYCSGSTIGVTGNLILDGGGDPNAVFVFQAGSSLTTAGNVILANGAQAKNVYWLVGADATITGSMKGNIVAYMSITLNTATALIGRALARKGAVTENISVITLP